jgi:pimeloyl-ACP methyl ester carboxylesterase
MQEKQILIKNLKTNYKIAGQGPVVLILHGWGASSNSWVDVQKILAEKKFEVIVPDFSGFGKSISPFKPWGIKEYVDFIFEFTEKIGINNFILIGHSFGGRVAVKFSSQYPEKVKKLILCDSAGIKPKPGLKTVIIFVLAKIGNALLSPRYLTRLKNYTRNIFYSFLKKKDYVKADVIMREVMKKVLNEDLRPDLPKIKVKTLIIWGGKDKMVPLEYAYIFKKEISGSELKIMPEIGHSPNMEAPEELSKIIFEFIN